MINLIKYLFILPIICSVIVRTPGYAMEDNRQTAGNKRSWRVLKGFKNGIFTDSQSSERVFQEYIDKGSSLETSSEDSLPKERGELDYRVEHERVKALIERIQVKTSVNFDNQKIFSLPNDMKIMKKWRSCVYINLSHNKLEALPDEICAWASLSSLDLSDNRLEIAPWQVFSIGHECSFPGALPIVLSRNPIKRFPTEFFEAMMEQKGKRKNVQGISLEFDQKVIEDYILPVLEAWPDLKKYLVESFREEILNGFCKIQSEDGKRLYFDDNGKPSLYGGEWRS